MRRLLPLLLAALLGVGAAVLVACGSSGTGLIPAASAGPLVSDFQAVERAAQAGNGESEATEAALSTTEHDFHLLPSSIDAGLRGRLAEGIRQLRATALEMCAQPAATSTTSTGETSTQTKPPTTSTGTQTTSTGASTAPAPTTGAGTTPTTPTEGGTAPEAGSEEGPTGEGGASGGPGSAGSAGGSSPGAGQGSGSGAGEGTHDGGVSGGTGSGEQ
jgi:hypothetical protein